MVNERTKHGVEIRDGVVVRTGHRVVGVRTFRNVHDWPHTINFFDCRVLESLASCMLAVINALRATIRESHHRVLPVADVVAEFEPWVVEHPVALVVRVEVEVERVKDVIGLCNRDDQAGARIPCRPVGGGSCPLKPLRKRANPLVGGQEDVRAAIRECVETIQITQ